MAGVKLTDTTFRDSHQSLMATRMRMRHMVPIIEQMDNAGFFSLEVWGGATFDSCIRYLNEDPWERLRTFKKHMKNTPAQMLLRGQNLVGYKHYSDDIVEKFVERSVKDGIDIFRIFDALNDVRNMEVSIRAAKRAGAHVQGTICYTISPVHTIELYVDMAKKLEGLECDSLCIKDMAGLISPKNAHDLVKALKEEISIPINLHSHCTSGMAPISYYAACEAGVDILDTAMSPFSWGASQPPTESMIEALKGTPYDTGIDIESLKEAVAFFKDVKKKYGAIIDPISETIDTDVLLYQIPGGMLSNLVSQLKEQNALDKYEEVLKEMPNVKEDLGHPPLVTPSSQIVGIQAVMNVLLGERYKNVTREVRDYVKGLYGKPPGPIKKEIVAKIIGEQEPITVRPADLIEPQYSLMKEEAEKLGINSEEDILTYALFPAIAPKFLKGELIEEPLRPPASDEGASETGIPTEFKVEVDGEEYAVKVEPVGGYVEVGESQEDVPENVDGGVPAPMQGMILKIKVKVGQAVKKGDTVAVLEAMKMQNYIHAPSNGAVKEIFTAEGATVNKGAVLMVIK